MLYRPHHLIGGLDTGQSVGISKTCYLALSGPFHPKESGTVWHHAVHSSKQLASGVNATPSFVVAVFNLKVLLNRLFTQHNPNELSTQPNFAINVLSLML